MIFRGLQVPGLSPLGPLPAWEPCPRLPSPPTPGTLKTLAPRNQPTASPGSPQVASWALQSTGTWSPSSPLLTQRLRGPQVATPGAGGPGGPRLGARPPASLPKARVPGGGRT